MVVDLSVEREMLQLTLNVRLPVNRDLVLPHALRLRECYRPCRSDQLGRRDRALLE